MVSERVTGERGASLVEIVVALVLVAVGLSGLLAVMPPAMQAVVTAGHVGTATLLARQALDQVRAHPHDRLCTLDTASRFEPVPGYEAFSRRITVSPGGCPPPGSGVMTVTVVVRAVETGVETTLVTFRSDQE